jgi:hypothetical protein
MALTRPTLTRPTRPTLTRLTRPTLTRPPPANLTLTLTPIALFNKALLRQNQCPGSAMEKLAFRDKAERRFLSAEPQSFSTRVQMKGQFSAAA